MQVPDIGETDRLRIESQQARLRLIETELHLVMTWCSVAKTEAKLGEASRYQQSMNRINRAVASLRQHINDPAHVPVELVPKFRVGLEQLERKVEELEATEQI